MGRVVPSLHAPLKMPPHVNFRIVGRATLAEYRNRRSFGTETRTPKLLREPACPPARVAAYWDGTRNSLFPSLSTTAACGEQRNRERRCIVDQRERRARRDPRKTERDEEKRKACAIGRADGARPARLALPQRGEAGFRRDTTMNANANGKRKTARALSIRDWAWDTRGHKQRERGRSLPNDMYAPRTIFKKHRANLQRDFSTAIEKCAR
jgi:hypothetical protein